MMRVLTKGPRPDRRLQRLPFLRCAFQLETLTNGGIPVPQAGYRDEYPNCIQQSTFGSTADAVLPQSGCVLS